MTIKRYFKDLPDLYNGQESDLNITFSNSFSKASEMDWQAVFVPDEIDKLGIPENAFDILKKFIIELDIYDFGKLPEDVIGELFEEIIDPDERHLLGQYFTNENLVDLILGFVVKNEEGKYLDPTCGSGTFLIRLYDRLRYLKLSLKHKDLLNKIWGIDIAKFPSELSTINLFRQDTSNFENFPRVVHSDVFNINNGDTFKFPPLNTKGNYIKIEETLPEFSGIVGNFPFIRHELIEQKIKGYKKFLAKVLAKEYLFTYSKLFKIHSTIKSGMLEDLQKKDEETIEKQISDWIDNKKIELKLSGQADIYAYIYIHIATLLAKNGTLGIITSNSWLDTSYGSILKDFFLDNFKVKAICASWAEPWFEDAAVNTIVTILEKEDNKEERENNNVHFVKIKKKLNDLIPFSHLKLDHIKRWQRVDFLVSQILNSEYDKNIIKITDNLKSFENENFRVRIIPQKDLTQVYHTKMRKQRM